MKHSGIPCGRFVSEVRPPDALYARIRASIDSTRAPSFDQRLRIALALGIAAVLAAVVVLLASQSVNRAFASGLTLAVPSERYLVKVLLLLVALAFVATLIALRRGPRGLGSGAAALFSASALVAPLYAMLVLVNPVHTDALHPLDIPISPWGLRCLVISGIVGVLVLASFTAALRRSIPTAGGLRGAAVGTAAGAWAGLSVFVFCPSGDLPHMVIGHVLPIAAFTLLGVVALPRLLRI